MRHDRRAATLALWMCGALLLAAGRGAPGQGAADELAARLKAGLAAAPPALRQWYARRGYRAAWVGVRGVMPRADTLAAAIRAAAQEGLDPAVYALPALPAAPDPDRLADVELRLTGAALAYAADVANGRVAPALVHGLWSAAGARRLDPGAWLAAALDGDTLGAALAGLPPPHPGYAALRDALARYRVLATRGRWPPLAAGPPLGPGERGPAVAALRARLAVEGDLEPERSAGDTFDAAVQRAVERFQRRHGLDADGVLGPATRAALDVPVAARIRQIELNLERWRWLPRRLGERYVLANSAAFTLEAVENDRTVLRLRTVVGRPDWPTPIVSARITGLLFSPAWAIPRSIAVREILPVVRRDPGYLVREGIRVLLDSGRTVLDPAAVDWSQVSDSAFAFELRQDPGPSNPLGGLKVVFPNRFDVYIHDTPARALFRKRVRTFSHGCVRAERAAELAGFLLGDPVRWARDSVAAAMTAGRERWVPVPVPVPVHVGYWTAWVDDAGAVNFRDDVYGWDRLLAAALDARR
jgi:murein L,D-transpeptidase YcbB/YkuD